MTARLRVATLNPAPNVFPFMEGGTVNFTFDFGFATIQTVSMTTEPELDDTGKDMECNKVTLEVAGVVNRVAIATSKLPAAASAGVRGDDLAYTMARLRDFLMLPRLYIRFEIGSQVVLESPQRITGTNEVMECDVRGGPFPQSASYTQFAGAKLAFLHYRVTTYVTRCNKYVLSNRYTIATSIDQHHYTTRTITGNVAFRKDVMLYGGDFMADDFRQLLPPPCPPDMRRVGVQIEQDTDGSELDYTITDREVTYGMGINSTILEVNGSVTANVGYGIENINAVMQQIGGAAMSAATNWRAALVKAAIALLSLLPRGSIRGTVRVTGQKRSLQKNLAQMAVNLLLDRMRPVYEATVGPLRTGYCVAAYITFNMDSEQPPYAEATLQCIGLNQNILSAIINVEPLLLVNLAPIYTFQGNIIAGPNLPAVLLDGSRNTRGHWLGRLLATHLLASADVCQIPEGEPFRQIAIDIPNFR